MGDDDRFAAQLEMLRRSAGIELDLDGHWWHDGVQFEHPLIIDILNKGLATHPETGEAVVRLGEQWCYVDCQGTPFIGLNVSISSSGMPSILLNTTERIDFAGVKLIEYHGAVHGKLPDDRLVRFSRAAQAQLAEHLIETKVGDYAVTTAAGTWPVDRN